MRLLSIDYGKQRTGIAVSDSMQIIANGLCTVPTNTVLTFLCDYISREPVERVIIGKPTQPNGEPSENLERVLRFVKKWQDNVPDIPIELYDERFTSVLAHKAMLQAGVKKKTRREDKGLVDEISATILLQDYMESRR